MSFHAGQKYALIFVTERTMAITLGPNTNNRLALNLVPWSSNHGSTLTCKDSNRSTKPLSKSKTEAKHFPHYKPELCP